MLKWLVLVLFFVLGVITYAQKPDFKIDSIPRPTIVKGLDSLDLDFTGVDSCERITLKLNLSSKGFIKNAVVLPNRTLCTNEELLGNLIATVREKMRYNEQPGVYDRVVYLTIAVKENE